tara:strand:+ start:1664 stop:2656 length:993 start_codon:yes stop_codon:yes gene_type:complete
MKFQKKNMIAGNNKIFLEILRPGVNTTIQDSGRNELFHLGITVSGAIDQKNFKLSNLILDNNINEAVLEFAFQGPLLKLHNGNVGVCISGEVDFDIIRSDGKIEQGICYQIYILENGDQIDIRHTKNSLYGYLAIKDGFELKKSWNSCSINTQALIGPNDGKKFSLNQKIYCNNQVKKDFQIRKLKYKNTRNNVIRVIKGTNFDYFSKSSIKNFFNQKFKITNSINRMGIRLEGTKLENIISTNIKSEGLIKGVIQVPADGNPIIMLADHGTVGGYPKIASVISADLDNLGQLIPNTEISFKEVSIDEAEKIYENYLKEMNQYFEYLNYN